MHRSLCLLILATQLVACSGEEKAFKTHGVVDADFVYIAAEEPGLIKEMHVHRGDVIKDNHLIARLQNKKIEEGFLADEAELERQQQVLIDLKKPARKEEIDALQSELEKKQAALKYFKQRYERVEYLYTKKFVSKDELDLMERNIKHGRSECDAIQSKIDLAKQGARNEQIEAQALLVKRAKNHLDIGKSRFDKLQVTSTQAGKIFDVLHHEGEYVQRGEAVASLLKNDNLKLVFYLKRALADRVQVGDPIKVNCHGCKNPTTARITYIDDEAEFTPTQIYDAKNSEKMVYRVEAGFVDSTHRFRTGQPVAIAWKK